MRKFMMLVLAGMTISLSGLAWAQKLASPRRPVPVMRSDREQRDADPLTVGSNSVTPATITFTSSTPDNAQTNATTEVKLKTTALTGTTTWRVWAKAGAANFTGCNTPPMTSVTMTCGTATNITCVSGTLAMSNTGNGTEVASGTGNKTASFYITYSFQDGWNYSVGTSCTLSVSYIYTQP
jgi:hypothetical protein